MCGVVGGGGVESFPEGEARRVVGGGIKDVEKRLGEFSCKIRQHRVVIER